MLRDTLRVSSASPGRRSLIPRNEAGRRVAPARQRRARETGSPAPARTLPLPPSSTAARSGFVTNNKANFSPSCVTCKRSFYQPCFQSLFQLQQWEHSKRASLKVISLFPRTESIPRTFFFSWPSMPGRIYPLLWRIWLQAAILQSRRVHPSVEPPDAPAETASPLPKHLQLWFGWIFLKLDQLLLLTCFIIPF